MSTKIEKEEEKGKENKKILQYFGKDDYKPELCKLKEGLKETIFRSIPGFVMYMIVIVTFFLPFINIKLFYLTFCFFSLNFVWTSWSGVYFSFKAIKKREEASKTDFKKKYDEKIEEIKKTNPSILKKMKKWDEVKHYVIIPNYKENIDHLEGNIAHLSVQSIAKTQIIVVLAMELREGEEGLNKFKKLSEKFKGKFLDIITTQHPPNIENELAGKSSNEAWAGKQVIFDAKKRGFDIENVLVSISDADSHVNPKHYDYINYKFCLNTSPEKRNITIYQGSMACFENFFKTPAMTRVMSSVVTMHELSCLADDNDIHVLFSTYTLPLSLIKKVNGWDSDVIAEDWHMFIKSFFTTNGKATVEPIPFHVFCEAVEAKTWWESIHQRYIQAVRHSWGVAEISYFAKKWYLSYFGSNQEKQNRPPFIKASRVFLKLSSIFLISGVQFWIVIYPFLVFYLCKFIPFLRNTDSGKYALNGLFSKLFQILMFLNVPMSFFLSIINTRILTNIKSYSFKYYHYLIHFFDMVFWATPVLIFCAGYPTFWAVTRLFKTDKFKYIVAARSSVKKKND